MIAMALVMLLLVVVSIAAAVIDGMWEQSAKSNVVYTATKKALCQRDMYHRHLVVFWLFMFDQFKDLKSCCSI